MGWKAERDGSIIAPEGFVAMELVSPKMSGQDGINQIKKVMEWLNSIGARVNKTTGLHVHIGTDQMDASALARLVCFVACHEKAFYASTGTHSRENGSYCRTIREKYKPIAKNATKENARRIVEHSGDRYYILNLAPLAYGQRNAVEFRCFAGTMNINKVLGALQLCLGAVVRSIKSTRPTSWDPKQVNTSRARYAGMGKGGIALERMMFGLGWVSGTEMTYDGVLDMETIKEVKKELHRLAEKYDSES